MPICIAKTRLLPTTPPCWGLRDSISRREVKVSAGAGLIVAITGEIMTMPGLPKVPVANNIDISSDGTITGLF